MGMVGGGPGAFIGEVHRKAVGLAGQVELVGGAFDLDPDKSRQLGEELNLDSARVYKNYEELIEKELQLPAGERMDFVTICVPNNWHFPIAKDLLEAGFHVLCEKPMTLTTQPIRPLQASRRMPIPTGSGTTCWPTTSRCCSTIRPPPTVRSFR